MHTQTKQTKHTPGPWQFAADSGGSTPCLGHVRHSKKACVYRPENMGTIASHIANWDDARLIAAAPELLEALNYVESAGPTECDVLDDETVAITLTGKGWNQLRDAIAKARGEA